MVSIQTIASRAGSVLTLVLFALGLAGCATPEKHRLQADEAAYGIIAEAQEKVLGRTEPFSVESSADTLRRRLMLDQFLPSSDAASLGVAEVERIPQWPDPAYTPYEPSERLLAEESVDPGQAALNIELVNALQIAARGSREYQEQKEAIFSAALRLDLERDAFRNSWTGRLRGMLSTDGSGDERVSGAETAAGLGLKRNLQAGGSFALDLGVDLVKLLTQDKSSAYGLLADATLTMPLLRGSGRFVVQEPLTQAERDVVYAIYAFEQFKQSFSVRIASEYLGVLQQLDQVDNARGNYERLMQSTRRARRLADAGQLPEIQVDQALQDELRARNRLISAEAAYERNLDAFKISLGLPADTRLELDRGALDLLTESDADVAGGGAGSPDAKPPAQGSVVGPLEMEAERAVRLALEHRLDLRTRVGQVFDAQRGVAVAADALRADLTLLGRGTAGQSRNLGSAGSGDARLDFSEGRYSGGLTMDFPLERTSERNRYRSSLIQFERAVRAVQELEDQIKRSIRDALRGLRESRETVAIQARSVEVAARRLESTSMFMEAGRAQIRDVLEAEEALLNAQNTLTSALVRYRVQELELQRDMGLLAVDANGMWREFDPAADEEEEPTE